MPITISKFTRYLSRNAYAHLLLVNCIWYITYICPLCTQNIQRMTLSVDKSTSRYIANQEAGVAFSDQERIETGNIIWLKQNIYDKTNHYIKVSHGYVPEDMKWKLSCHVYATGLQWIFLLVFVIGLVSPVHFIFAFLMAGFSILFIVAFCQHMYVVIITIPSTYHTCLTMPWNLQILGKHTAMFAASTDTAVGVGVKTKGTIKIHVLSTQAPH